MNVCTDDNLVIGDKAFVSVKSFAVITYENTNTDVYAEAMEKTFINEMNRTLNTWHLNFLRQKSVEKESEISYLIFNVNLHVLINFAKTNNLKSFFYCYLGENGIEYDIEQNCHNIDRSRTFYMSADPHDRKITLGDAEKNKGKSNNM